ncbi:MAG TPA: OmpA family protein [Dokdonella sp.]
MSSFIDWPRYSRWTWIVAALLVLLLLVLWLGGHGPGSSLACCGKPAATVAPPPAVAPLPAAPATPAPASAVASDLKLVYQGGKVVLTGVVPDQAMHDRLLQSAVATYGAEQVVDRLRIDAGTTAWACASKQDALFAWLKSGFRSGITCNNDGVTLTGVVASEAEKAARVQSARDFFGAGVTVTDKLVVVAPLATVGKADDVRCGGSIAATVNFSSDSAAIDEGDKQLLDAIAKCLNDGQYEIGGHTDSSGNDEINLPLSQQRADSVRSYLIGKGVAAANLSAVGYGAERPIADNATEEGKARNRRIEFTRK